MPSWDPRSYVAEALSRHITAAARQEKIGDTPSYYDALTSHLQAHEESESVKASLEAQSQRNAEVVTDFRGTPFAVVYNARTIREVSEIKKIIENLLSDTSKKSDVIYAEFLHLNGGGGEHIVSSELFDILKHIKSMSSLTKNMYDPTIKNEKTLANTYVSGNYMNDLKLMEGRRVFWPAGMLLSIGSYMKAWLVDHFVICMREIKDFLGAVVTYEGFTRAFGVPEKSEMWKGGIWGLDLDGKKRYVDCLDIDDDRPAFATHFVEAWLSDPFGMRSSTACCRTLVTAYCLAVAVAKCDSDEVALRFIHDWRKSHNPDSMEFLLGFLLVFGTGRTITDLSDNNFGENDALRLQMHDRKAQVAHAHQQIERKMKYEECALKAIMRSNSADGLYLLSPNEDKVLEKQLKKSFSVFTTMCTVMSYMAHGGTVCVTTVKMFEFSRGDLKCCIGISQCSPLYNYIFETGSELTLNFFLSNGSEIYESILSDYPSWINQSGNEPIFFEVNGKHCVTTGILKKECTQNVFLTLKSFLVGDQLFVVGQLLGATPQIGLIKCGNSYTVLKGPPSERMYPFFFTTVHKLYGTVGLVGHGCHLCSFYPPIIMICCPSESSTIVLDENNVGPKCFVTILSSGGASIFHKKMYKDLRCGIPIPASTVSSLSPDTVAFQIKGRILQVLSERLGQDILCMIAVTGITTHSYSPLAINVNSENDFIRII
ncbi:Flavin transferase ApbE [Trypanosoma melophagium]|uniref:Flavin transferase ApbE n=1 Tax=Trypanosoma melophagium TaxID=715481 RepID=UPI00351A390D|nr:Flavin transferase ApbE [Trypanosoma melophagium]